MTSLFSYARVNRRVATKTTPQSAVQPSQDTYGAGGPSVSSSAFERLLGACGSTDLVDRRTVHRPQRDCRCKVGHPRHECCKVRGAFPDSGTD